MICVTFGVVRQTLATSGLVPHFPRQQVHREPHLRERRKALGGVCVFPPAFVSFGSHNYAVLENFQQMSDCERSRSLCLHLEHLPLAHLPLPSLSLEPAIHFLSPVLFLPADCYQYNIWEKEDTVALRSTYGPLPRMRGKP